MVLSLLAATLITGGELQTRLERNFDRLEEEKYQPAKVFLDMKQSWGWPGDTEGRTILGLVMDAKVTGREPKYLEEILRLLPTKLNERGYLGPIWTDGVNEQQLSGHGWLLRGLCEYYAWKRDPRTLDLIRGIADGLFLPAADDFATYPIDPQTRVRNVGGASGETVNRVGRWELSSDVGCFMIGIDGLVQARQTLGDAKYDAAIEKAIRRFLEIDQVAIRAQAHATLTGLRALLRFGDRYLADVERIFRRYRESCMTETFANANWFMRFETHTEPCAIVDSYMVALQLWERTGRFDYLELADRIYWNALCRAQRKNGGFGLENCPSVACPDLKVRAPEAHWCCTMRGAEGLSAAADFVVRAKGDVLTLAQYHTADVTVDTSVGRVKFREETTYPFGDRVTLTFTEVPDAALKLRFFAPSYLETDASASEGFVGLNRRFKVGETVTFAYRLKSGMLPAQSPVGGTMSRRFRGPLLTGTTPDGRTMTVHHVLDEAIWTEGSGAVAVLKDAKPWLIVNEDNDHYFKCKSELMTEQALKDYVDNICRGHVTHFFMCPSGQRASFDSKTWEPIWAGIDEPDRAGVVSNRWCVNAKLLRDRGIDPYAVWTKHCREKGVSPWISMRMNDVHYSNISNYFRNTTFCRTRKDLWISQTYKGWSDASLDYAKAEVRAYSLAHVKELVDRYDIDGLELDWMRFGSNLRYGHELEDAHFLDGFMRDVRSYLDLVGGRRGRRIALGIRACRDPELTRTRMGMDVAKWAREGLVDLVVPHSFYRTDSGLAVAKWIATVAAANPSVRVVPGIDMVYVKDGKELWMTADRYRGVARKFYAEGAKGLYLFNLPYLGNPRSDGPTLTEDVAATVYAEGLAPETVRTRPATDVPVYHDFP